jgi:hypothetical protein
MSPYNCQLSHGRIAMETLEQSGKKERKMDVGFIKTMGEDTECPGTGSNQTRGIRSLHYLF